MRPLEEIASADGTRATTRNREAARCCLLETLWSVASFALIDHQVGLGIVMNEGSLGSFDKKEAGWKTRYQAVAEVPALREWRGIDGRAS